jgi:hypothetical protein
VEDPSAGERDDFIFDYIKGAPEALIRDAGDLDGKVVALFGAASVVLGLAAVGNVLATTTPAANVTGLLIAAVSVYVSAAAASLVHLWPKTVRRALYGESLWSSAKAAGKSAAEVRDFLLDSIEQACSINKNVVKFKGWTLIAVTTLVGAEVGLIAAALIASRY